MSGSDRVTSFVLVQTGQEIAILGVENARLLQLRAGKNGELPKRLLLANHPIDLVTLGETDLAKLRNPSVAPSAEPNPAPAPAEAPPSAPAEAPPPAIDEALKAEILAAADALAQAPVAESPQALAAWDDLSARMREVREKTQDMLQHAFQSVIHGLSLLDGMDDMARAAAQADADALARLGDELERRRQQAADLKAALERL